MTGEFRAPREDGPPGRFSEIFTICQNLRKYCTIARMSGAALLKVFRSLTTVLTIKSWCVCNGIPQGDEGVWWVCGTELNNNWSGGVVP